MHALVVPSRNRCVMSAAILFISAEPHQQREAAGCNDGCQQNRNHQDHRTTSLLRNGGDQCTETYRGAAMSRGKPSVRLVGTPTHLSVMSFPTSPRSCFGRKTLRHIWQRLRNAACARLSAFLAVSANGPATQSRPPSLKSSVAITCATSRSFPNGSRRPF